jgi:hypothetical protein
MPTIKVDKEHLKAFGRQLKGADKELRRQQARAVQRATKPVKQEIKASAIATLPSRGGLGLWASKIGIRTRQAYSGRNVGITITGTIDNKAKVRGRGKGKRQARTFGDRADLRAINRGRIMHPVYGRGPLVGPQMVKKGFWDKPMLGVTAQRAKREILEAMVNTLRAIQSKRGAA